MMSELSFNFGMYSVSLGSYDRFRLKKKKTDMILINPQDEMYGNGIVDRNTY